MRTLGLSRYALAIGVSAALLAGCGGSQPPIGGPGATPQGRSVAESARKASSSADTLIYAFTGVSNGIGFIFSYPSGERVDSFQTPVFPVGSCSDSQGDVFLAGYAGGPPAGSIVEYAYGASSPFASVTLSPGETAWRCSVDNTTGNVAAIARDPSGGGYLVVILPKFQGPPAAYYYPAMLKFASLSYDDSGDLFLLGEPTGSATYALAELTNGGSSFEPVSLNLGTSIARSQPFNGMEIISLLRPPPVTAER